MGWRLRPLLVVAAGALPIAVLGLAYALLTALPDPVGLTEAQTADMTAARRRAFALGAILAMAGGVLAARWLAAAFQAWSNRARQVLRAGPPGDPPPRLGLRELDELLGVAYAAVREREVRLAELARARAELSGVLEAVHEGILQVTPDARVVLANRVARELLRTVPRIAGEPIAAVVRNPTLREVLERAVAGEEVHAAELVLADRHVLVAARPLAEGGALAVFVDLTELRRLEDVRRDFVINASHELKTPLTSIRGYAETLLGDDLPPDVRRNFLQTIHANAERLQRIVDDLLDLSRIESGGWQPRPCAVDVAHVAREAWEVFDERARGQEVAFEAVTGGAVVWADPVALRQVLSNLFDNALRYTAPGGRITVRATHEPAAVVTPGGSRGRAGAEVARAAGTGDPAAPVPPAGASAAENGRSLAPGGAAGWVRLDVEDTGSGIPSAALPRIFERFYRVDSARSRNAGGTGLGLSIVRHLLERMGGDVSADSELGKGTTIHVRLPAATEPHPVTCPLHSGDGNRDGGTRPW